MMFWEREVPRYGHGARVSRSVPTTHPAAGIPTVAQKIQGPSCEGCLDRGFSWPWQLWLVFIMVSRSPALPLMPNRRGWLQGVVHRPVELFNYPLSPGSRQRRTPGKKHTTCWPPQNWECSGDRIGCLYLLLQESDGHEMITPYLCDRQSSTV